MKYFLLQLAILIAGLVIVSCHPDKKPVQKAVEAEVAPKVPKTIEARTDSLSAAQLKDIETIHETFTEVYPISLNETIKNFKDNQDSGREIEIWLKMVETYKGLIKNGQYSSLEQRQEVFSVILASTMMPLATIKDKVNFQELDDREVDKIYAQFMGSFSPN